MKNLENNGQALPSINLENMDYTNHKMILTSPRSIEVCRQKGVDIKDLYFYNFYEFRKMHPELTSLNIEIQKSHYFHEQGVREVLLSQLIRERRELINNENEYHLKQKEEKKRLEQEKRIKMKDENPEKFFKKKAANDIEVTKNKQKKQLFNILEANLREAYIKKEKELKSQLEENKKNDLLYEERMRKKEQEKHKKFLEEQKQRKEQMIIEEQKKIKMEYEQKEKIREQKEKDRIKYNNMLAKEKEKERKEKAERFKENLEYIEHRKKRMQEEREFKETEKQYNKRLMDKYKNERRSEEMKKKKARHDMIMNQVIEQKNIEIKENLQKFKDKQDKIENNLYQNMLLKNENFMKKKKEEEDINKIHQNNLDWNEFKKEKNDQLILERQNRSEQFKIRNDLEKRLLQEERQKIQREKEEQMKEQRAYIQNMKLNDDLNRINEKQELYEKFIETKKLNNEKERKEKEFLEEEKKERMYYERSKIENNYIDNSKKEMEEKEKRYQLNREKAQKKLKEKYDLLKKQKEEKEKIKKEFEDLTSKNKGEIDIEKIKELFPDDEELHKKLEKTKSEFEKKQSRQISAYERGKIERRSVLEMKTKNANKLRDRKIKNMEQDVETSNKKAKKRSRPKTANKMKTNLRVNELEDKFKILSIPKIKGDEILTENKIKYLLNEYKSKAMKEFLLFCNKEKAAENERKEIFAEAKTEKEKKRLKNILKMQNAQSVDKIGEFNKLIDEKIIEYEKALMDYFKKQKNSK